VSWQYSPFFVPLLFSAAVCAALGVLAYRKRGVRAAGSFTLLMASSAWWSFFYALYVVTTSHGGRLLWATLLTAGAGAVAVAWLLFAIEYTGRRRWLTRRNLLLLAAVPALTLLLLATNAYHGWFWPRFELTVRNGLVGVAWTGGPAFWLHVAVSWVLMSASVALLLTAILRSPTLYRRQAAIVLFGALVPWLGNVVHLLGLVRFPVNPMPVLFAVSGMAFGWAVFRFGFLTIVPVAREAVIETMDDAVIVVDEEGYVLDANPAALRILDVPSLGNGQVRLAEAVPALATTLTTQAAERSLVTLRRGEVGPSRSYDVRVTSLPDGSARLGSVLVLRDVTERSELEAQLRRSALHDPMTGLPNRVLLLDRLEQAVERTRRGQHPFALLFLDLDQLKRVNDELGHVAGDTLLVAFANRLAACMRPSDTVARLSGDEFAVLLEDIEDLGTAIRVAERIQHAAAEPIVLRDQEIAPSVSIGIVLSGTTQAASAEMLLSHADTAMYRAKRLGSVDYMVFDAAMQQEVQARIQLEAELRRAIARNEFVLYYHAIVDGRTNEIAGFEALVRWDHPTRGMLTPAAFMSAIGDLGLMAALSEWSLQETVESLERWRGPASAKPLVAVLNVGAQQLVHHSGFVARIEESLTVFHARNTKLMLDISEMSVHERRDELHDVMGRLSEQGVLFAVDDFGTGASSLPHLQRLPIAALKIDHRFIGRLETDSSSREVTRVIVSMAHALQMPVIAEGVETPGQLAFLRSLGCDFVQGYLFGQPVPDISMATHAATAEFMTG
jgi:diguanylate cyclase (GGDEF)-like protein